ncbi:MAG: hypothetical protein LBP80_10260, partial [Treponema sp.]|nr:hypothetical protein [Treponema sp.]
MMNTVKRAGLFLTVLLFLACESQEPAVQSGEAASVQSGPAEAASVNSRYTGDGGKGTSITITAPEARGLAADQNYLPQLVQAEFMS